LISYSLTLIFCLLHYLGGFELDLDLDLDPNEGETKLDLGLLTCFFLIFPLFSYGSLCVCKVVAVIMYREEWMYKIPRVSNDFAFLGHVRKFIAAAKKHRVRLGQERIICPCNSCKNNLLQEDNMVQSHLIRHGFVKDYTI